MKNRSLTSEYIFSSKGGLFYFCRVAKLSVNAKYRFMVIVTYNFIWLKQQMIDLGNDTDSLTKLFCDNKATIDIAFNQATICCYSY